MHVEKCENEFVFESAWRIQFNFDFGLNNMIEMSVKISVLVPIYKTVIKIPINESLHG